MRLLDRSYPLVRRLLFSLDAERAHELTLSTLGRHPRWWTRVLGALAEPPPLSAARQVGGVTVAGPVGLAAGLDKDGVAVPVWGALGFGFVEVGTVTMHPQPGNPKPRLFRLPEERALINRMGFNNHGSASLASTLRRLRERGAWPDVPVGANIGKSKVTPLSDAAADYATSARRLRGLVDWFTVNVSSPNTPGLRDLQDASFLREILPAVLDEARGTPVWLKLAPDLSDEAIRQAVQLARQLGVAAIVATNTTIRRDLLAHDPGEAGGLSGRPLRAFALDRVRQVVQAAQGLPVVGVGGVESAADARALLDAGCAAVQLYTAFIYEGPGLPSRLHRDLGPGHT